MLSLEEKVDPRHTALIVVDVQNDFCHSDGAMGQMGFDRSMAQAMASNVVDFIARARENGVSIIFIRAVHDGWTDSPVWQERRRTSARIVPTCREDSWGAELYRVEPQPDDKIVVKRRYSAFYGTDLDVVLRAKGIKTLLMTGVSTNVCVETTARDGFQRDYYIVFVENCCAANSVEVHQATLRNINAHFGVVVNSAEVVEAWSKRAAR